MCWLRLRACQKKVKMYRLLFIVQHIVLTIYCRKMLGTFRGFRRRLEYSLDFVGRHNFFSSSVPTMVGRPDNKLKYIYKFCSKYIFSRAVLNHAMSHYEPLDHTQLSIVRITFLTTFVTYSTTVDGTNYAINDLYDKEFN